MKLVVFSDSHGRPSPMIETAEREQPDMILFLGDGEADISRLRWALPQIPVVSVPGNCDYRVEEPLERLIEVEGKKIFLCHGHTRRVKQGLGALIAEGHRQDADLVLYGHTHLPKTDHDGNMTILNPGTIGSFGKKTYAVVKIEGGQLHTSILPWQETN
jgi:putative phosphoesterase